MQRLHRGVHSDASIDTCQVKVSRTCGPPSPKHERFTHLRDRPIHANRNAVQHQSPRSRSAPWVSVATMQQYPARGFTSEPGVLWNPVRGTTRSADGEPSVRCATLGFDVQHLRRWNCRLGLDPHPLQSEQHTALLNSSKLSINHSRF